MLAGEPFVQNSSSLADAEFNFEFIKNNLIQYIIGSLILSISTAILVGLIAYYILNKMHPKQQNSKHY